MIRSHFGLQRHPFDPEALTLLAHQQEIFDILRVHAQQGGLCLVLGEPGTGKSVLKQALLTTACRPLNPLRISQGSTATNTFRLPEKLNMAWPVPAVRPPPTPPAGPL
jgi:hypothetical protein